VATVVVAASSAGLAHFQFITHIAYSVSVGIRHHAWHFGQDQGGILQILLRSSIISGILENSKY
jgi:hypothetical protein